MARSAGTRVGPYEILSVLGAGGRGSALELAERCPATANSYENAPVARFPAVPVVEGVMQSGVGGIAAQYSISDTGTLAYVSGGTATG